METLGIPARADLFRSIVIFLLHSTNQTWKDLMTKKHVVEELRSWLSSLEVAKESQILQRRCGVPFSPSLGEVRGKKKKATSSPRPR